MSKLVTRHFLCEGTTPIQGQACDIINSILDDPSPELEDVKRRLYKCLADHPNAPELALLAQLMETSELVNAHGGENLG